MEFSQITTNNVTIQDEEILSNASPIMPNLSITLHENEKEVLQRNGKFSENSSTMDITQQTNGTLATNVESVVKDTTTTTLKEVSIATDVGDECVEVEEDDESVIPVDEDDDDDVEEVSTLENTDETAEQSICNMFSHLQPNKTAAEKENSEKSKQDQEMSQSCREQDSIKEPKSQEKQVTQIGPKPQEEQESIMEQEPLLEQESILEPPSFMEQESAMEPSQYLTDENDLFQYPFVEVGRRLWPSSAQKQHYTKGCLWSPDGTCLLVPVHLDGM